MAVEADVEQPDMTDDDRRHLARQAAVAAVWLRHPDRHTTAELTLARERVETYTGVNAAEVGEAFALVHGELMRFYEQWYEQMQPVIEQIYKNIAKICAQFGLSRVVEAASTATPIQTHRQGLRRANQRARASTQVPRQLPRTRHS